MFGTLPEAEDYGLDATLLDVRKEASGTKLVAVIGFSGPVTMPAPDGPSLVNGEIHFAFEPPPIVTPIPGAEESKEAAKPAGRGSRRGKEGVVDARGWITEVKMASVVELPQAEGEGRLKTTVTYEIVLARRPLSAANRPGEPQAQPLGIPNPPPTAAEANSWLVYEDPLGRFSFRHPQVLSPLMSEDDSLDQLHLADTRGGRDRLVIMLQPKEGNAERQLAFHDPQHFQRDDQPRVGQERDGYPARPSWLSFRPSVGCIKVARFTGWRLGSSRSTAAQRDEGRVYVDYYLVDFNRGQTIIVESWTDRDNHVTFRNEAEAIIKSFEFGPGKPQGSRATSPPSAAPRLR